MNITNSNNLEEMEGHITMQLNEKWKNIIDNITSCRNICGICMKKKDDLINIDAVYVFDKKQTPLNSILETVFGFSVANLLLGDWVCDDCVDIVLKSSTLIFNLHTANKLIHNLVQTLDTTVETNAEKIYIKVDVKDMVTSKQEVKNGVNVSQTTDNTTKSDSEFDNDDLPLDEIENSCNKFDCCYCDKQLSSYKLWKEHSGNHSANMLYSCRHCSREFMRFVFLARHRRDCHLEDISFCDICKLIFDKEQKRKHYIEHHNDIQLVGDVVNKPAQQRQVSNKPALQRQVSNKPALQRQVSNMQLKSKDMTCQECLKTFTNEFTFKTHACVYQCNNCRDQPCIHERYIRSFIQQQVADNKPFKCIDCNFTFTNKQQIIVHADKEHLNNYPHLDSLCGESFLSEELLKYHSNDKHKQLFECNHCGKDFKDEEVLMSHVSLCEITEKPYQCDLCTCSFTSQGKAYFHRRKHYSKNINCPFCLKCFWTKRELNMHKKKVHADKLPSNEHKIYKCTMCFSGFNSKNEFRQHSSSHTKDSTHVCRDCKATFRSKISYSAHVRRHKLRKDKECPTCHKFYNRFTISGHLKTHQVKETINSSTMCDICGRFLLNEMSLKKHRKMHQQQQQCPHCLKFINTVLFEKHLKMHNPEGKAKPKRHRKVFKCSKCQYKTCFLECFAAHENRYHLQVRPFRCDICNKGFYAKFTLNEHRKIHSGLKPEQCHECGNRFVNKKALKEHIRIHTGEKPYPCDLCNEKFISASRMQAHRVRKHFDPTVQCQICSKMYYTQSKLRLHVRDCHSGEPRKRKKTAK